jgi:uncharacterized membrane protein YagU involved in acid resistance
MNRADVLKRGLLPGATAGLVGGLVLGVVIWQLGSLPTIASLVQGVSPLSDFLSGMMIAALVGALFGLLTLQQRPGAGETLFWGLAYGLLWWLIGPLTLLPLLRGTGLAWDLPTVQTSVPSFLGHLLYGTTVGLALALVRRPWSGVNLSWSGSLIRGSLAGLLAGWLLTIMLDTQDKLMAMNMMLPDMMAVDSRTSAFIATLFIGLLAGLIFALLYPNPFGGIGAGLIRGSVYGFLWWVVGSRTLAPILTGDPLGWSLAAVRSDFATLPAYILFGAILVFMLLLLHRLSRLLFVDDLGRPSQEGVGTQGLRALGRGVLAGTVGGLLFTVVMVQIGFLPIVANLVGATSAATGLIVHLIIAVLIGMSYGVFFHRQSYDTGSALAWGASYGVVWWILGPLTLMPVLLGSPPQWSATFAAESFAALVGHLAYGASMGLVVYWLEARYRPWWVSRSDSEKARAARRKDQILTSAPALWMLVVVIALTLPMLLGM